MTPNSLTLSKTSSILFVNNLKYHNILSFLTTLSAGLIRASVLNYYMHTNLDYVNIESLAQGISGDNIPYLLDNRLDLYWISLESSPYFYKIFAHTMEEIDTIRASKFHFIEDRERWGWGRIITRHIISRYLNLESNNISFHYNKYNKPEIAINKKRSPLRFNISHSGDRIFIGITYLRDTGVDTEKLLHDKERDSLAKRIFTEEEWGEYQIAPANRKMDTFYYLWTRKESYLKAIGAGLAGDLKGHSVSLKNEWVKTKDQSDSTREYYIKNLHLEKNYAIAFCRQGKPEKVNLYIDQSIKGIQFEAAEDASNLLQ